MTLGEFLREQRLKRKWTLQQLARKVGCSRQYLSAVELGEAALSRRKLRAVAVLLGSDGLALRLLGGDVPDEVIEALRQHPELVKFLVTNARHPDLSTLLQ